MKLKGDKIEIHRDENGIPHIRALTIADACFAQGYVHATDRGMQMLLMRILGQGRAAELLDGSDKMVDIDRFFRKMNWAAVGSNQTQSLTDFSRECLQAYAAGVNEGFGGKVPWEFRLLKAPFEAWRMEDSFLISRMIGYLTLSQSQGEVERLLIEMIQAGVAGDLLEELFPGLLSGLDRELVQSVKLDHHIVPSSLLWELGAPRFMASNNWVLSGRKTASGHALLCNDPHLEINRIPNVWQEIVMEVGDNYLMGGCMPGAPGVLSGRNRELSWGVTYSFMDGEDSWIERCKDGRYYREGEGWKDFQVRKETIKRKGQTAAEVIYYQNEHGVLAGDPRHEGLYLASRWACGESGARTLTRILEMWNVKSVEEGMRTLGQVETAWNFVFADRQGAIGYQMSGLMPLRRDGISGLVPLPGWLPENDWQGFAAVEDLPRSLNPEQGFFVTTNNDLNRWGKRKPLNMPMGPYRAERVESVLHQRNDFTRKDMIDLHYDVYSTQAEQFMKIIRPLLPDQGQGKVLQDWDMKYDPASKGASLFERVYRALYREVFGKKGVGAQVEGYLYSETGMYIDFYINFDRILLSQSSRWFGGESREAIYRRAIAEALSSAAPAWGSLQKIKLSHILFGGKFPSFLGFDRGPITLIGGRATPHQGQIYRSAGRLTTFAPSFRTIIEMQSDVCHTNLIGGATDRRFSKWYCSDLQNWLQGRYKELMPGKASGDFP